MSIVKIDGSNESNFTGRKVITPGKYVFEIANDLIVEKSKSSDNNKVEVQLRCVDEGEFKGSLVFDSIPLTPKCEWRLCNLAMAAGRQSKEEIKSTGVDLSLLKGSAVEVIVAVKPPEVDPVSGKKYKEKNEVERYCFDAE
jgi:hypothetical protein